jgi:hypothetical protein
MAALRRQPMRRLLGGARTGARDDSNSPLRVDQAQQVRHTLIDFETLKLPADVSRALADAFWNHFGARDDRCILVMWANLKVFGRFAAETAAIKSVADVHRALLVRYVDWLNARQRANGKSWTKSSRSSAYTTLRKLLQWLERCRPGVLGPIEYPFNPFPWRNRDTAPIRKLPAAQLRAILKACERDIAATRARRARFEEERVSAEHPEGDFTSSRVALVAAIERRYGGILPTWKTLHREGDHAILRGLKRFGGAKRIAPLLYPDANSILPYYLAILIHTAGNPDPIAALKVDCLQPIPLLDDRQMIMWEKHRAGTMQRRSFRVADPFEPPALVRELLVWTQALRCHVPPTLRHRLLLCRGARGTSAWTSSLAKHVVRRDFLVRHGLPAFSLASIRPSVLTAFYRASGDLRQVKTVANHSHIGTTVRYVEGPQVEAEHRVRVAALQNAFLGHIERPSPSDRPRKAQIEKAVALDTTQVPPARAVSLFGFDCKDPFAGIAPESRRGELCTHFLGCFTCPNAVIPADAATLARLLQARDHLRAAAATVHPARWQTIYRPPLQILEEDILPRFGAAELAAAAPLRRALPPLPELR